MLKLVYQKKIFGKWTWQTFSHARICLGGIQILNSERQSCVICKPALLTLGQVVPKQELLFLPSVTTSAPISPPPTVTISISVSISTTSPVSILISVSSIPIPVPISIPFSTFTSTFPLAFTSTPTTSSFLFLFLSFLSLLFSFFFSLWSSFCYLDLYKYQ